MLREGSVEDFDDDDPSSQKKTAKRSPRSAKRAIIDKLSQNPQVLENLFGNSEAIVSFKSREKTQLDENALINKLAACHDVSETLRKYGMEDDVEGTRQVVELLPIATQAPPDFSRKRCSGSRVRAGGALLCAAAFACPLFNERVIAQASWTHGLCKIVSYANGTCYFSVGGCLLNIRFVVAAEDGQVSKKLQKNNWQPTSENDQENPGQVRFSGAWARCCMEDDRMLSCCSLSDEAGFFCDDWAHKVTEDGSICRFDPGWDCRAKLDGDDVITELEPYKGVSWLFWFLAMIAAAIIVILFLCGLWALVGASINALIPKGGITWHKRLAERLELAAAERAIRKEEALVRSLNSTESVKEMLRNEGANGDEEEGEVSDEDTRNEAAPHEASDEVPEENDLRTVAVVDDLASPQAPPEEDIAVEDVSPSHSAKAQAGTAPRSPKARTFSFFERGISGGSTPSKAVEAQPEAQPASNRDSFSGMDLNDLSSSTLIRDLRKEKKIGLEELHPAYRDGLHPSSPKAGMRHSELAILAEANDPRGKLLEPRSPSSSLANGTPKSQHHRSPPRSPSRRSSPKYAGKNPQESRSPSRRPQTPEDRPPEMLTPTSHRPTSAVSSSRPGTAKGAAFASAAARSMLSK